MAFGPGGLKKKPGFKNLYFVNCLVIILYKVIIKWIINSKRVKASFFLGGK